MGSTITLSHTVKLYTMECCSCGIIFGVPDDYDNRRRQDKRLFYCPSGHPQSYTKSDADKLREQLAEEQRKLSSAQFELMAAEKKVKRLEKRAKNGVCPCCHRQFVQLTRHMQSKHPDFAE